MTQDLRVGVLGATGLAGQQVLAALERHPWFRVAAVGASESSAGKSLGDALRDPSGASRWFAEGRPDSSLLSLPCLNDEQLLAQPLDLVFSAVDNVIPFSPGEEEKVERETKKILGHWGEPAPFAVSCTCTRVNVTDGHLETVFVGTERPVDAATATAAMERFGVDGLKGLPSAPDRLLQVTPDPFRPQPRRDRNAGDGMTVTVGRVRDEPALRGVKYVVLSHNTKLGAGKGAVLLAEWLTREGYVSALPESVTRPLLVQKFGGSSIGTPGRIKRAAKR